MFASKVTESGIFDEIAQLTGKSQLVSALGCRRKISINRPFLREMHLSTGRVHLGPSCTQVIHRLFLAKKY
jgi:hypothetical protein